MAREEKNKYSNIEHVRTNMLWMDIKIVDPEMEALMKQINEEQTRLKEALREKLRLMKFDNDIIQKENEQTKEWLRTKGIQLEETRNNTVKEENASLVKEEPTSADAQQKEHQEAKVSAQNSKETNQTKEVVANKTMEEVQNINMEAKNQDGYEENPADVSNKTEPLEEAKIPDKGEDNSSTNDEPVVEESAIATRTRRSVQIVEPVEDVLYSEKRSRRGTKRRKVLKKHKTSNKRKKECMEKIEEMDSSEDGKGEGEP